MAAPGPVPILVDGVSKAFGPVQALVDIHLRVRAGEFLSLINLAKSLQASVRN